METFQCIECGAVGEYTPIEIGFFRRSKPQRCAACITKWVESQKKAEEAAKMKRIEAAWAEICPPLYAKTELSHPDIPQNILDQVLMWQPNDSGSGLGLYGETGHCKTRMMFLLLKRLHFEGIRVAAISAKSLSRCFQNSFGESREMAEARERAKQCRLAKVLLVDDLGKEKFTEHVESEFYDLIEYRTSYLKPTLWTSNAAGRDLRAMMSADRGDPIIRRLREFSEIIHV